MSNGRPSSYGIKDQRTQIRCCGSHDLTGFNSFLLVNVLECGSGHHVGGRSCRPIGHLRSVVQSAVRRPRLPRRRCRLAQRQRPARLRYNSTSLILNRHMCALIVLLFMDSSHPSFLVPPLLTNQPIGNGIVE